MNNSDGTATGFWLISLNASKLDCDFRLICESTNNFSFFFFFASIYILDLFLFNLPFTWYVHRNIHLYTHTKNCFFVVNTSLNFHATFSLNENCTIFSSIPLCSSQCNRCFHRKSCNLLI